MSTFAERIRQIRGNESQRSFAPKIGVSRSALAQWELGTRVPDLDTIQEIAKRLGVSAAYLRGEIDDPRPLKEILDRLAIPVKPIPIIGEIHAGDPIPAEEQIIGWTSIPADQAKGGTYFALRVEGDCMEGGTRPIHDGDVVIVRQQPEVHNGEIAVVLWPEVGEAQLRRVYRQDGTVVLKSDNPVYPPEIVRKRELQILGRVVSIQTTPAATVDS